MADKKIVSGDGRQQNPVVRLTKAYVQSGISRESLLVPAHFKNIHRKYEEFFNNQQKLIERHTVDASSIELIRRNAPSVWGKAYDNMPQAIKDLREKEISEMVERTKDFADEDMIRNRGVTVDEATAFWNSLDEETRTGIRLSRLKQIRQFVMKPFVTAGFHETKKFKMNSWDQSYALGVGKSTEDLTWNKWGKQYWMFSVSDEYIPKIYAYGKIRTGKTNLLKLGAQISTRMYGNWLYSNMPFKPRQNKNSKENIFLVRRLSDFFIDVEDIKSIVRLRMETEKLGRTVAGLFVADEWGIGSEAKARTTLSDIMVEFGQVQGHFLLGSFWGGETRMAPSLEKKTTALIHTGRDFSGSYDKAMRPSYKRYFEVYEDIDGENAQHRTKVTDPPKATIETAYRNAQELPYQMLIDFSMQKMMQAVDFVSLGNEELLEETTAWIWDQRRYYNRELKLFDPYDSDEHPFPNEEDDPKTFPLIVHYGCPEQADKEELGTQGQRKLHQEGDWVTCSYCKGTYPVHYFWEEDKWVGKMGDVAP